MGSFTVSLPDRVANAKATSSVATAQAFVCRKDGKSDGPAIAFVHVLNAIEDQIAAFSDTCCAATFPPTSSSPTSAFTTGRTSWTSRASPHGWVPFTMRQDDVNGNVLLIDMVDSLGQFSGVNKSTYGFPVVKAQCGILMVDLLTQMKAVCDNGVNTLGYTFPNTPGLTNVSLGGVLALLRRGSTTPRSSCAERRTTRTARSSARWDGRFWSRRRCAAMNFNLRCRSYVDKHPLRSAVGRGSRAAQLLPGLPDPDGPPRGHLFPVSQREERLPLAAHVGDLRREAGGEHGDHNTGQLPVHHKRSRVCRDDVQPGPRVPVRPRAAARGDHGFSWPARGQRDVDRGRHAPKPVPDIHQQRGVGHAPPDEAADARAAGGGSEERYLLFAAGVLPQRLAGAHRGPRHTADQVAVALGSFSRPHRCPVGCCATGVARRNTSRRTVHHEPPSARPRTATRWR